MAKSYSSPVGDIKSRKAADGSSSPMGDIKKALRKVAEDPKDPNAKAAKAALLALGDEDDAEASDGLTSDELEEVVDATRPKGASASRARAKALVDATEVTNLSPYAAQLDEEMGLAARQGTRVEGNQLILSSGGRRP
jgi:hypothetical protein